MEQKRGDNVRVLGREIYVYVYLRGRPAADQFVEKMGLCQPAMCTHVKTKCGEHVVGVGSGSRVCAYVLVQVGGGGDFPSRTEA